ncbi:tRNA (adenosine(37)-N6)-threonylcarbamoyltransferase complex transferase subunit TsaD [Tepidamorphus sp. 3E244]|uniref:tRNA (adenosine(37)-N6)-threonylcarbamoyltransferase complex transferase subunit TsaD n=1 Tax=Tepidamorphus sp. 3E244 TaxID=3385498 RepID=UPI0038FCB1BE
MQVIGIETSCDETAAAVVRRNADGTGEIVSNVVLSQIEEHSAFGGVVPEIAARAHVESLDRIIAAALDDASVTLADIDWIAATAGPGLIGGLLVGLTTAKALSWASGKPLLAVNHLEGHALTARLTDAIAFPYLLLLVSGGHTQLVAVHGVGDYRRLGTTIDDAAGEAFDKTAKLLGLGYPGGSKVETHAQAGDEKRFALPRPLKGRAGADFSFAGLKTAVRLAAQDASPLSDQDVNDLAASFQRAAIDCIADRTKNALKMSAGTRFTALVAAGGVAANKAIGETLAKIAADNGLPLVMPPLALCGDNAAMIAWAGAERLALDPAPRDMTEPARARWPLDSLTKPGAAA